MRKMKMRLNIVLMFLALNFFPGVVKSQSNQRCDALASYYVWPGTNLTFISTVLSTTISTIHSYNPNITDVESIVVGARLNGPMSCGLITNGLLAHQFIHQVRPGDTYEMIAELYYSNLTTVDMMRAFNRYDYTNIPIGAQLNVTVNCSCGDARVSRDYGLFITYTLRPGESLSGIASEFGLPERLLQDYNPGVDFRRGSGLVFIPGRDQNGTYPRLITSSSSSISHSPSFKMFRNFIILLLITSLTN